MGHGVTLLVIIQGTNYYVAGEGGGGLTSFPFHCWYLCNINRKGGCKYKIEKICKDVIVAYFTAVF